MASGAVTVDALAPIAYNCNIFDGVDDYVEIAHDPAQLGVSLKDGFTISAWIFPFSAGESNNGRILDKSTSVTGGGGFKFNTFTSNTIYMQINGGTARGTPGSVLVNKWSHVVVTVSAGSLCNFYVNGTLSGSADQDLVQPISAITTTGVMRIGNRTSATDLTFDGGIRNLKMWNRVLTQAEITNEAGGGDADSTGLIYHFKLYGDYKNYGSVGGTATNSGSQPSALNYTISNEFSTARTSAADSYYAVDLGQNVMTIFIDEA